MYVCISICERTSGIITFVLLLVPVFVVRIRYRSCETIAGTNGSCAACTKIHGMFGSIYCIIIRRVYGLLQSYLLRRCCVYTWLVIIRLYRAAFGVTESTDCVRSRYVNRWIYNLLIILCDLSKPNVWGDIK